MKKTGRILLFVVSVFLLAACTKETILNDRLPEIHIKEELVIEISESVSTDNDEPESKPAGVDENDVYEEYINSLQYLDEVEAKLTRAETTADMVGVTNIALEAWDKELNKIYALLTEKLPVEEMEKLRTTQRLWIKERNQLAHQSADSFEGGSLAQVAYNNVLFQCTKQRTMELISIYFSDGDDYSFAISLGGEAMTERTDERAVYRDILQQREPYSGYYAITENIPSNDDIGGWIPDSTDTRPYYFAIHDINNDGIDELLLGYGMRFDAPNVLLNILQYNEAQGIIIDLDGERTYPLMDGLIFYESGYYTTQNGVGGLYTECWYINDDADHYWYGYERPDKDDDSDSFFDSYGSSMSLSDYYNMVGENRIPVEWKEITAENIIAETLSK